MEYNSLKASWLLEKEVPLWYCLSVQHSIVQHHGESSCCKFTQWRQKFWIIFNMKNNVETEIKFSFMISSVDVQLAHVYLKIYAVNCYKKNRGCKVILKFPFSCFTNTEMKLKPRSDFFNWFFFLEGSVFCCHIQYIRRRNGKLHLIFRRFSLLNFI